MGMNMSEKILAQHAGLASVEAGQLITCKLDMVLANDITAPPAIKEFEKIGGDVFDPAKIALVPDHFTPNKDMKTAELTKIVRDFAREQKIVHYFEVGHDAGIEHVILPEQGLVGPGMLTIGADSHTCTYGAVNGFSTGVGTTDLAVALATGEAWFKVPSASRVVLRGEKPKDVCGKDVILTLIGMIGVDGALYQTLEFAGDGVQFLGMDDRFTIANMAIEAGAKNGIFPFDDKTRVYLEERIKNYEPVFSEAQIQQVAQEADVGYVGSSDSGGGFVWPLPCSQRVTSRFGNRSDPFTNEERYHSGIDIDGYGNEGAPVIAAAAGEVITASYDSAYGNYVIIDHGGTSTVYAHMSGLNVYEGQQVSQGETIGTVGSTGRATGTHLHFEVYVGDSRVDPAQYFSGISYYNC